MSTLIAVVESDNKEINGQKLEIFARTILRCPGCKKELVHTTEDASGQTFVGRHNMTPLVGNTEVTCEYSGECLVFEKGGHHD